jgi:phage terminase small subunit
LKAYPTAKPGSAAAAATRLLKNVKLKRYIDIRQEQIDSDVLKRQIFTKERILQEESYIASANIRDIFDENREIKELHDWPEGLCAAIKDLEYDRISVGTDDHGKAKYKYYLKKLTFHDKGAALNRLEKCYGMQRKKKEVSGNFDIRAILARIDGLDRGKLPQEE